MAGSCREFFGSDAATLYLDSFFGRGTSIRWSTRGRCAAGVFDVFDRNAAIMSWQLISGGEGIIVTLMDTKPSLVILQCQ